MLGAREQVEQPVFHRSIPRLMVDMSIIYISIICQALYCGEEPALTGYAGFRTARESSARRRFVIVNPYVRG